MQFSLALIAVSATAFFGIVSAAGPPPGCRQTADHNAGYCLCSTTITTATPTTSTVTTEYTSVSTLRGPRCFPRNAGPPAGCRQTADANAGYCLCTTVVPTSFTTTTDVPVTTTSTSTLRGPKCFPSS